MQRRETKRCASKGVTRASYLYSIDQRTRDVLPEVVEVSLPVRGGSSVSLASFSGAIEHVHCWRAVTSTTSASRERPAC